MNNLSNNVGEIRPQRAHFDTPLTLAGGGVLPAFDLVYETYGELNASRSNAVLVCHAPGLTIRTARSVGEAINQVRIGESGGAGKRAGEQATGRRGE